MKFIYTARTKKGEPLEGEIEAPNIEVALKLLSGEDIIVTSLRPEKKAGLLEREITFLDRVSRQDIILFTKQLATLLRSNISLVEALSSIAAETNKKGLAKVVSKIADAVESGQKFSEALSLYPKYFSEFYIGVVKAGETSGTLPESLEYLANYMTEERRLLTKFISSLIYPALVFVVFNLVLIFISIFLVPRFEELFRQTNVTPPFITKLLFTVAGTIRKYWWAIVATPFLLFFSWKYYTSSPEGKKNWHKLLLSFPFLRGLFQKFYITRIALTLSTMIRSGVSILRSLEITRDVVGNKVYEELLDKTIEQIKGGQKMSLIFSLYPEYFPSLFVQMISTGEKTGKIEDTLQTVVSFYTEETERALNTIVRFIEPAIILVLAVAVVGVALGIFLPLFQATMSV